MIIDRQAFNDAMVEIGVDFALESDTELGEEFLDAIFDAGLIMRPRGKGEALGVAVAEDARVVIMVSDGDRAYSLPLCFETIGVDERPDDSLIEDAMERATDQIASSLRKYGIRGTVAFGIIARPGHFLDQSY